MIFNHFNHGICFNERGAGLPQLVSSTYRNKAPWCDAWTLLKESYRGFATRIESRLFKVIALFCILLDQYFDKSFQLSLALTLHPLQVVHKRSIIEFSDCTDYLVVFVLSFFERVFNCSLLLLTTGVA